MNSLKRATDYNFLDGEQPDSTLVAAGTRLDVASLKSANNLTLQLMAQRHAAYQAARGVQGHQNWEDRVKELYAALPEFGEFSEVCAESWPDQSLEDSADEMYNSWRQSPSHWAAVSSPNDGWGYAMCYCSRRRVWFACGIFAHRRQSTG